jgi:hypothetical protein
VINKVIKAFENRKYLTMKGKSFKIYSNFIYRRITMKKLLTAGVALLSVATLAACSGKTASESSNKEAKASSSKVEKSSTSESKSSSSEKKSKSSVASKEVILLTDEEIDNAKTIGDFKNLYGKLVDNYKKYAQDIGQQIPEAQRATYTQQIEPAIKAMDDSKAQFNNMLSSAGSDDTLVPEQGRTPFLTQIRTARDSMKNILEGVYQSIGEATSSSAE